MSTQPENDGRHPEPKHTVIKLDPRVCSVLLKSRHVHPNLAVLLGTEALKPR